MNSIEKSAIRTFLQNHLLTNCMLEKEIIQYIFHLLHGKGKIFSTDETHFSWGGFYAQVSSFHLKDDTCIQSIISHAAAIELLILATDIFDEISDCDQSDPIVSQLSIGEAILIANALMMEAFRLILHNSKEDIQEKLSIIISELQNTCNGQWKDLHFIISECIPTEEEYFTVVKQKSSALVKLVCELGDMPNRHIWETIAADIGIAGQLKNDARDIMSDDKSDLINRKATLPFIKAIEYSSKKDNGWLIRKLRQLKEADNNSPLIKEIRNYIQKTGATDYCFILSKIYMDKALNQIAAHFPEKQVQIARLKRYLES
ncbi:polyprenyl synthetase family protein [Anoxybacteroides tepidamans]|uniref:polyprenyl synthetase family protein n=1 Tax=Anoxybacteroides tepidamans TaxID=265948 RepID=UPI00048262B5|nr:polyprenyl synthetase family protein [Anoxybacillus tepidamans]